MVALRCSVFYGLVIPNRTPPLNLAEELGIAEGDALSCAGVCCDVDRVVSEGGGHCVYLLLDIGCEQGSGLSHGYDILSQFHHFKIIRDFKI